MKTPVLTTIIMFACLFMLMPSSSWSKSKTTMYEMTPINFEDSSFTKQAFKEKIATVNKMKRRSVASTNTFDEKTALSVPFRNIRNYLIGGEIIKPDGKRKMVSGAKTAADIHRLLVKLDKDLASGNFSSTPDAEILAVQLLALKPLRGFIARSKNIFETKEGNARSARSMVVTGLRAMAAGLETYLPTEQWSAAYDYVVQPYYKRANSEKVCLQNWSEKCYLTDGPSAQAWLMNEMMPRLENVHTTLAKLTTDGMQNKIIYWDNKILYGTANFVSHNDRYLKLGQAERLLMLSATQATQSAILGLNAYHLDGLFESFDTIAKTYGIGSIFNSDSATAKGRFKAIRKHPDLFRFKTEEEKLAREYMRTSYQKLKAAMQTSYLAWKILDRGENNPALQANLLDPRLVAPFQRIWGTAWPNMMGIVGLRSDGVQEIASPTVRSAVVNGEKVVVKLRKFFNSPPHSLQDFMPISFVDGTEFLTNNFGKYRNYRRGNPNGWKVHVYGEYFENVKDPEDVRRVARVLSQSWGGFLLGLPLNLVMM